MSVSVKHIWLYYLLDWGQVVHTRDYFFFFELPRNLLLTSLKKNVEPQQPERSTHKYKRLHNPTTPFTDIIELDKVRVSGLQYARTLPSNQYFRWLSCDIHSVYGVACQHTRMPGSLSARVSTLTIIDQRLMEKR